MKRILTCDPGCKGCPENTSEHPQAARDTGSAGGRGSVTDLVNVAKEIRESDCGAWMKDGA